MRDEGVHRAHVVPDALDELTRPLPSEPSHGHPCQMTGEGPAQGELHLGVEHVADPRGGAGEGHLHRQSDCGADDDP